MRRALCDHAACNTEIVISGGAVCFFVLLRGVLEVDIMVRQ